MASPLIMANFVQDQTVTMNIKVLAMAAFDLWKTEWESFMKGETTDLIYETEMYYERSAPARQRTETNASGIRNQMVEGFQFTTKLKYYASVITIGKQQLKFARKDHKFEQNIADSNTRSIKSAQEYEGANVLSNGFTQSAAFLGGDGYCFFSASHTWKSGGTYTNLLDSSPFAKSTVESQYTKVAGATMEYGQPAEQHVKKIIFGTDNYFTVPEVYFSQYNPETNTNSKNMLESERPNMVLSHYLASPKSYFLQTESEGMNMKDAGPAEIDEYQDTTDVRYLNVAINQWFGAGFSKPMATYGCQGV